MAQTGREAKNSAGKNIRVIGIDQWLDKLPNHGAMSLSYNEMTAAFKKGDEKGLKKAATVYYKRTTDDKGKTLLDESQLQSLLPYLEEDVSQKMQKRDLKTNQEPNAIDHGPSNQSPLTPVTSDSSPKPARARDSNKGMKQEELRLHPVGNTNELMLKIEKQEDLLKSREIQLKEKESEIQELQAKIAEKEIKVRNEIAAIKNHYQAQMEKLDNAKQETINRLEKQVNDTFQENSDIQQEKEKDRAKAEQLLKQMEAEHKSYVYKKTSALKDKHESDLRTKDNKIKELIKDRDDMRDRFSKVAGEKLTDQNADIADLSDPNRAMKLSEKFGQLYDDEWTNAFEALTDKKIPAKNAIQFLLRALQECLSFCDNMIQTQMDSIKNVFLHPSQDVTKFVADPRKNVGGINDRPRIVTKDEKALRAVRRQIGVYPNIIEEVKKVFHGETKSWDKKGYDKKMVDLCTPYLQKCAEICWLMVLHDPPLSMKLEVKPGEKLDPNFYTVYSTSGDKIDYLVWPPLYNGRDGGLLSKGVAEPQRLVKKK